MALDIVVLELSQAALLRNGFNIVDQRWAMGLNLIEFFFCRTNCSPHASRDAVVSEGMKS